MNVEQPPLSPRNWAPPPDDVDGLLRDFFRAKMPDPWPACRVKRDDSSFRETINRCAPRPALRASRFALAATVALCLAGSAVLTAVFPPSTSSGRGGISGDLVSPRPDFPGKRAPIPVVGRSFQAKTPSGRSVKGWEEDKGRTTIIRVEVVETPTDED
jgi:hypothetical protein